MLRIIRGWPAMELERRRACDQFQTVDAAVSRAPRGAARDKTAGPRRRSTPPEELVYEGSLPKEVGVGIVDALSDNKNRTAGEVRATFKKHGGALGAPGSVAWNWRRVAEIRPAVPVDEDKLFEVAVEAGADDVVDDAVFADPALSASIRDALDAAGFVVEASDRIWIPEDRVDAPAPHAALDALDALDDVSAVWHNAQ